MVESLLSEYPNVLVLRVRMPIVGDLLYPRNFITKIIKYDKVIACLLTHAVLGPAASQEFIPVQPACGLTYASTAGLSCRFVSAVGNSLDHDVTLARKPGSEQVHAMSCRW